MTKIHKALLLYKRSVYLNYFLSKNSTLRTRRKDIPKENLRRLKEVHAEHYQALNTVEECLKAAGVPYQKSSRGERIDYSRFDLVITVGGDGTFLEGSRNVIDQPIVGVNSSPRWSVGKFCTADIRKFPQLLHKIIKNQVAVQLIHRLRLRGIKELEKVNVLNDVLLAHRNPAAMSRYTLRVRGIKEEQRSSGIWIATAAGSSGAIHSAGGKILPIASDAFQYYCRELYTGNHMSYRLKQGVLSSAETVTVTSLMRDGMIFVDGARFSKPFLFGTTLRVSHSPYPLKVIMS